MLGWEQETMEDWRRSPAHELRLDMEAGVKLRPVTFVLGVEPLRKTGERDRWKWRVTLESCRTPGSSVTLAVDDCGQPSVQTAKNHAALWVLNMDGDALDAIVRGMA